MSGKFAAFDAAGYSDSEEAIAAYLEAAQEESGDDPAVLAMVLSDVARARNMSQLARDAGLTRADRRWIWLRLQRQTPGPSRAATRC